MATVNREEVTIQVDVGQLAWLREVADKEGRDIHEVLKDAVDVYHKHRLEESLGPEGVAHFEAVIERMGRYQKVRESKTE